MQCKKSFCSFEEIMSRPWCLSLKLPMSSEQKWIFINKTDEKDCVTRTKARLVAQGYSPVEVWILMKLLHL